MENGRMNDDAGADVTAAIQRFDRTGERFDRLEDRFAAIESHGRRPAA
jgi:hypothetical protein